MYYRLQGREVVPSTQGEWAAMYEDVIGRRVGATLLPTGQFISTVFLGLDHGFGGDPILFETMIFPEQTEWRYRTLDEAEEGHLAAVRTVLRGVFLGDVDQDDFDMPPGSGGVPLMMIEKFVDPLAKIFVFGAAKV